MFRNRLVLMSGCATVLLSSTSAVAQSPYAPGQIIIHFTTSPTPEMLAEVERAVGIVDFRTPRHAPHARNEPGAAHPLEAFRIAIVDPEADVTTLANLVGALATVRFAATNSTPRPAGAVNDPLFPLQWSHTKINTASAWDVSFGDTSIIVASIDTGTRITHEDLDGHIWVNDDPPNGIDDDQNGFIDDTFGWDFQRDVNDISDVFGHGTQVAGIIAAEIDNGLGVAGIGNLTVMTSKWWHSSGTDSSIAESVFYAVDNGARVLNLSLGCGCLAPMTEVAINYAHDNDVVVVSASGNSGISDPFYPAWYPNSMSVGAITIDDQRASFSNYGRTLDVVAPSPNIHTTSHIGDADYDAGFRGTSAASPHVAGLAGLIRAVNPDLPADEVRALINDHATDFGTPGFDDFFGNGRIDVGASVAAAVPAVCSGDSDGSGVIDIVDLLSLLADWGDCVGCVTDLDGNGEVDISDLLALLAVWGPC